MSANSIIRLVPDPPGFGDVADEVDPAEFASDVPVQHTFSAYEDDALGLYVGVWDTGAMVESPGIYPCDEFMWLLEGECQIKNNATGELETVSAGMPFVIPKGYDCQWQQTGYLKKYFLISEHPNEPMPAAPAHAGVVIPTADAAMTEIEGGGPFSITSGAVPRHNVCYEDTLGRFSAGTWAAGAFESAPAPFPYHKLAYVQDGAITLIDESGERQAYSAGDAFFIPQGVACAATVTDTVRLFFAALKAD